ncbi:Dicer-like protein 2 [Podosphaera aphanis]|nr:Dicer-like protein 2 [Podosphaera aphanis]
MTGEKKGQEEEVPLRESVHANQSTSSGVKPCTPEITPRSYQIEMYEESLKRNIIVAAWKMDTGSGKTHVAVMRIKYELECMSQPKLIWFLAPTVSLCGQQYEYIQSQITFARVKFLSGADNVDRWTEQSQWDDILNGVSVVVSTYQILLDALTHGFVQLESVALIVFDEAHNCVGRHPGAKTMDLFYHPRKMKGLQVPHILGLSASPVMGSKISSLIKIEQTLDSLSRTPTKTRSDLRNRVKLPSLIDVHFTPTVLNLECPNTLKSLLKLYIDFKIEEDPYYLSLIDQTDFRSQQRFEKLLLNRKTWCYDQIKAFYFAADTILAELGPWAANYYISGVISKEARPSETNHLWDESLEDLEKRYFKTLLQRIEVIPSVQFLGSGNMPLVSDKVAKMINVLMEQSNNFSGIVFVQERAVVTTLAHLLRIHPLTCNRFKVGSIVGYSSQSMRSNMFDLVDVKSQKDALPDFRSGKTNLLIGTSVLEEGIDAPSCNIVLCFQKPPNLKSFVQRRGRARQQESKLILLVDSESDDLKRFKELEVEMKAFYEDQTRELGELTKIEESEETEASKHRRIFRVEKTGAILDLDNAVSHLYHFCATLPADKYVDTRPDFIISKDDASKGLFRGRVILPTSVNESVRTTDSLRLWKNEKNSMKDAAFEAYVKLYNVGLISDNLLPVLRHLSLDDEFKSGVEVRPSIINVKQIINPWLFLAKIWDKNPGTAFQSTISLNGLNLDLFMPIPITKMPSFKIYWDSNTEITISIGSSWTQKSINPETWAQINEDTEALLNAARILPNVQKGSEHVIKFKTEHPDLNSQLKQRQAVPEDVCSSDIPRLIRDHQDTPYVLRELLPQKPDLRDVQKPSVEFKHSPEDVAYLSLKRLTRRRDFLNRPAPDLLPVSTKPYFTVIPLNRCRMDVIPFKYYQFSLMIPSIMHKIEQYLIAENLCNGFLREVKYSDPSLVLMAICAGSAGEPFNYQRLEFLGDSILKFCAAMEIMAANPMWHEGNLSLRKDHLVANSRLARAAVERGLDRYIITDKFADKKWHPQYVNKVLHYSQDMEREMSTKVLADVVESLVGAAMLEGGLPKALSCLRIFLPEIKWEPLESCRNLIYEQASTTTIIPDGIKPIQTILGYTFKKASLLVEALTHASYPSGTYSLERLEFIGDSILDHIVVQNMYTYNLPHMRMHELRTALVNADLLAVISMELHHEREVIDIDATSEQSSYRRKSHFEKVPLYCFLRHNSPGISNAQKITEQCYRENREEIQSAISNGTCYPWTALCSLKAEKFFSDLVEALLGAVWIDSGSLAVVEGVVERMGILRLLRRMVTENVDAEHPKIKLGKLAVEKKVEYVVDKTELSCSVLIGGKLVVTVENGLSRLELETRAATEAVKCLQAIEKERGQSVEQSVEQNSSESGNTKTGNIWTGDFEMDDEETKTNDFATGDIETSVETPNDMVDHYTNDISDDIDLIEF